LERKRQQFQIESQHRRKDGSSIWVRNSVSLIPGFENVPQFILTLSEDITERKRAEAALRDAEEFKNRLIASSEDCIKMLDLEGRLPRMNEGNAFSTGCSSLSNTAKLPSTKPLSLLPANAAQVFTPISLPTSPPWCILAFRPITTLNIPVLASPLWPRIFSIALPSIALSDGTGDPENPLSMALKGEFINRVLPVSAG